MACLKSGLDQRFFLALKVEDARVDLSRAAVSLGGGQRIGRGGQTVDLLMQPSDSSVLTQARKATGSFGQPMSSFPPCTCNDGIGSFDTA
jgi:hypothetical protein